MVRVAETVASTATPIDAPSWTAVLSSPDAARRVGTAQHGGPAGRVDRGGGAGYRLGDPHHAAPRRARPGPGGADLRLPAGLSRGRGLLDRQFGGRLPAATLPFPT